MSSEWLSFAQGTSRQAAALFEASSNVREWLDAGGATPLKGRSLMLVGIGASYAAAATPTLVLREGGVPAYRSSGGDLPDGGPQLADYYVGISQSGRSRETVQALTAISEDRRVAVVNKADSPLGRMCDITMDLGSLTDSRMSSIGFTATVMGLGMLADHLVHGSVPSSWDELGTITEQVVAEHDQALGKFAQSIASSGLVDVVGRSASLTAAEQGALLFREGPFLPSTAMDTRSYLHGPMDCAGETSHVIFGREREGLLADQLAEQAAPTLLVTDRPVTAAGSIITIPDLPDCQRNVVEVALLQRLVLHVGQLLGRDVDATVFRRLDTKIDDLSELGSPR